MSEHEWCYSLKYSSHVNGPFASRKEAIEAAIDDGTDLDSGLEVGQVRYILVEDWARPDLERFCEEMDEALSDEASFDDPVFELRSEVSHAERAEIVNQIAALYAKIITSGGHWYAEDLTPVPREELAPYFPGSPTCEKCNGRGEVYVGGCTCGGGEYGAHEPGCGHEQCECTMGPPVEEPT